MIRSDGRDVDVVVPVIVIVADRASQSVHLDCQSGLLRDIGKRSVLIVVVQSGVGVASLVFRPLHRIDQQDVLPAIVVVVDEANAAPHRFRK